MKAHGPALVALLVSCASCTRGATSQDPPDAPASPQAKAVPAQLANVPPVSPSGTLPQSPDAGPPPISLRGDHAVPGDSLGVRDMVGYALRAVLRTSELPPASKGPEVSVPGLEAARKKTEPHLQIELSPTRARMVLSNGFVLPEDTELRARVDRYGFLVLTPNASAYRIAAPGSLRALFGERRLDVAPLSPADVAPRGEGPRRGGYRTRKVEIVTRAANATIEIARLPDVGDGGTLVCRALLDLVNAPPSTTLCGWEEVPLHAELRWTTHGSLTYDVVSIARRTDLSPQLFVAPPASAVFLPSAPPSSPGEPLLTATELAALRTQPVDVPDSGLDPASGLTLVNSTDELRMAWLDGVPVAWVSPGSKIALTSLARGRYSIAWRTFLGDILGAPEQITVPGTSRIGDPDAGP